MVKSINLKTLWFGIPLVVLFFLVWLAQSPLYLNEPNPLTLGITLDFLITIPFIYALVIWKRDIPKFTILSVLIVCIIIASYIIPESQQGLLTTIKTVLVPLIVISLVSIVVWQARKIIQEYKESNDQSLDFFELIGEACKRVLPGKAGLLFATEIAVIYYGIFGGKKKEIQPNEYTYFKKSGIKTVVVVVLCIALCELVVMHLLVHNWSATVAWVLTFLSAYACLQIIALLRSMDSRLFIIDEKRALLKLKYGFVNHTNIPLEKIKIVELNRRSFPKDKGIIPLSPLDLLDSHNVIIELKGEHTLNRIYGLTKQFTSIAVYVDDKEQFVDQLNGLISKDNSI